MTPVQARDLLDNETFQAAIQEMRAQMLEEISHTGIDERERRESCFLQMKAIDLVIMRLEIAKAGGAVLKARDENRRLMS